MLCAFPPGADLASLPLKIHIGGIYLALFCRPSLLIMSIRCGFSQSFFSSLRLKPGRLGGSQFPSSRYLYKTACFYNEKFFKTQMKSCFSSVICDLFSGIISVHFCIKNFFKGKNEILKSKMDTSSVHRQLSGSSLRFL